MPPQHDTRPQIRELIELRKKVLNLDPNAVLRSTLDSNNNFQEAVPYFTSYHTLLRQMDIPSALSSRQAQELNNSIGHMEAARTRISNFNPITERLEYTNIYKELIKAYDAFADAASVSIPISTNYKSLKTARDSLSSLNQRVTQIESEAKGLGASLKGLSHALQTELDSLRGQRTEADSIIDGLRKDSAISGVISGSTQFEEEASRYLKSSRMWLAGAAALGLTTAASVAILLFAYSSSSSLEALRFVTPDSTLAWSIQVAIGKVLLFSFFSYLTIACLRNYRSSKHNEVLNRHRLAALGLFESFVNSAAEQSVKEAIVLAAANSAFGARSTGFDRHEDQAEGLTPLVSIEALISQSMKSAK